MLDKPKIGIIGIGMVGTPLVRYFIEVRGHRRGIDLFLYDIDPAKGYTDATSAADIIFISVPTPRAPDGSADLCPVRSAFGGLGGAKVVVIKSTVPPGTTEAFQREFPQHKVLFNPEFLTERRAWEDFTKPDRQIVGFTPKSLDAAGPVLALLPKAPFMSPWGIGTYHPLKITATEAELIKYAGNVFFARKVNFANIFAMLAEKWGANYEHVQLGLGADHRVGSSHLDVAHGGYKGFGGYCLGPNERLFVLNDHHFKIIRAKEVTEKVTSILGWRNGKVVLDRIMFSGRRRVSRLLTFVLSKGRRITVTPDHIMMVSDGVGNLGEKRAAEVTRDDRIPVVLDGFRGKEESQVIHFYDEADVDRQDIFVEGVQKILAERLRPYLTFHQYKEMKRTRRRSAVPLAACLRAGVDVGSLRIKTSITGSWVPATLPVSEDFARLLGYYLAEGCVTDGRVLFSFGYHEKDLAQDIQGILRTLRIPFSTKVFLWSGRKSTFTVKISSRILSAWFSKWGRGSMDKQIPSFIFHAPPPIKDAVLAGIFRGDGSVFKSNQGNYYTVNFATVSQLLAEGVDALLREKGILASVGRVRTAKTRHPAWSLDISESRHVAALLSLFTERQRRKVVRTPIKRIQSPAYKRVRNLALLTIRAIREVKRLSTVISLETLQRQYITSWGILTHNCLPKDLDALRIHLREHGFFEGADLLDQDHAFNQKLLASQGLVPDDISLHDHELIQKMSAKPQE